MTNDLNAAAMLSAYEQGDDASPGERGMT